MARILVVGCGDIGYRVALALHELGHDVTGLKKHSPTRSAPFPIMVVDIQQTSAIAFLPTDFQQVLFIVSAGSRQADAYQMLYQNGLHNLLSHFASSGHSPSWLMVSSTSVYGQNQAEWVDENSETKPISPSSQYLLAAEKCLLQLDAKHCVVRFSGIYGPGRDWLLRRAASGESIQQQPPSYTNRIHQDDCVGVLVFLMQKQLANEVLEPCYIASDNEPVPLWDVMHWIAHQYGLPEPNALIMPADAPQNKRCSNAKLVALGYQFLFPSYRDGYLKPTE
jgi:nucleoside-diphosphate-sugar epimerase